MSKVYEEVILCINKACEMQVVRIGQAIPRCTSSLTISKMELRSVLCLIPPLPLLHPPTSDSALIRSWTPAHWLFLLDYNPYASVSLVVVWGTLWMTCSCSEFCYYPLNDAKEIKLLEAHLGLVPIGFISYLEEFFPFCP